MNKLSALHCVHCAMPFGNLPRTAFIETETAPVYVPEDRFSSYVPASLNTYEPPNELGRKTFYWYRIYCGTLAVIYAVVAIFGSFLFFFAPESNRQSAEESVVMGAVYAIVGIIFFIVFLVALTLPPKPYNWIVGLVMIAIGMTSCCMWPAVIPLLIYWIKPETRKFFGRN